MTYLLFLIDFLLVLSPSYSQAVSNRYKKRLEAETRIFGGGKQDNSGTQEQENTQEEVRREKHIEGENHNVDTRNRTGPCKPRETITPRVVLSDLVLQAHREHMATYVIICKFAGYGQWRRLYRQG